MKHGVLALGTVVAVTLASLAPVGAHDEPNTSMAGRLTVIKKGILAKFIGKPPTGQFFDLPDPSNDPIVEGAVLHMLDLGNPTANELFLSLPPQAAPLGWRGLGTPAGSTGYKYKGAGTPEDPCKVVLVKTRIVKAVCKGAAITLDPPFAGELGIVLTVGVNTKNYCTVFGGTTSKNVDDTLIRRSAPLQACSCGSSVPTHVGVRNTPGSGSCGTMTVNGMDQNLACSGLYFGAGLSAVSLPAISPDSVNPLIMNVDCCAGDTLILSASEESETARNSCTRAGCNFGAPLPIPNANSVPTSTCVFNKISRDARGETRCDTGTSRVDIPLISTVFLTGDILPFRCSGGTNPGGRCTTSTAATDCPGAGVCVANPAIQPCPICNPGTHVCNGGSNNGLPCVIDGGSGTGLAQYPTSHDCPTASSANLGDLPIPFLLTTGTSSDTAAPSGSQQRVFCGFCRDKDNSGSFGTCVNGPTPGVVCSAGNGCGTGGTCTATPCSSNADCAQPRESCEQRSEGAFASFDATTITEIGTAPGSLEDFNPHPGTLVSVFCIPPTFSPLIDAVADLPGPGAVSLPSDFDLAAGTTTTSTTLPCNCCGSLPSLLKLTSTGGGASAGALSPATCRDGTPCVSDATCAPGQGPCLGPLQPNRVYVGGGNAGAVVDVTRTIPDSWSSYLKIASCSGGNPTLSGATPLDVTGAAAFCPTPVGTPTAEERHCTDLNCYLGPPIEIGKAAVDVAPCNNINKVCGLNVVGSATAGSLACGTGNLSATFRVDKRIYCGACPRCTGGTVGSCASGTCDSGDRAGMTCTPETSSGTSLDCPPTGSTFAGVFGPIPSFGTTGSPAMSAFATSSNSNIFCGYCSNGMTFTTPCTADSQCTGGAVCTANSDGAFGRLDATTISMTGSSPNTCVASGVHPVTLVNVGCLQSVGQGAIVDAANALPGPTATSLRGTIEIVP
jgi:hypothetical protein